MKKETFYIGKKEVKIPLFQGGMGIGISLGGLAGAVAKEGGVGIISISQIGYREPDFYQDTLTANLRAIHKELQKAREIAPDGIIGFNIMVAMNQYEEHVKEAVKAGADIIVSGAGLPVDLPKYVEGSDVALAPIVSTEKSAKVILKYWDRKYHRTADVLIIEGPKAGGHLGFSSEQLETFTTDSYHEEVRQIIKVVREYERKYNQKIPVILGGGIQNRDDYRQAMALGVDGIQVATRFVTTEECDADVRYKQAYIKAQKEDIEIIKSPVGMPGRAIRNEFIKRVEREGRIPPKRCFQCIHTCDPGKTPYCITEALIHAAKGELTDALLFCGSYAYNADKIETVKEVIDSFHFF
ncbi:MAG: nitronate monooxygenase family protein [Lachnospiraceae bacterium]|nr:nitronate monooxygenase family protein [Lachnospiraceae bacterium]